MCISPIYSNSHSSVQTVDRNNRTTPFDSYNIPSQALTSQICVTPHSFLTLSEAISLMCISPIYSNSHSSVQTIDRNNRTTPFDIHTVTSTTSQICVTPHSFFTLSEAISPMCISPIYSSTIAQSIWSIETNGQRRSTAIA